MDRIKEELSEDPVTLSRSSEIADWASRTIPEAHGEWQICHSFAIPVNGTPRHSMILQRPKTPVVGSNIYLATLEGS